jgi:hypothetical protein
MEIAAKLVRRAALAVPALARGGSCNRKTCTAPEDPPAARSCPSLLHARRVSERSVSSDNTLLVSGSSDKECSFTLNKEILSYN